ncbi:MAG: DUF6526 family protein [Vicinamibacterales bacterium]|jgi:hypothetical protein|nr:DUF6526 family protein [Vicinamibacterales bacterium]
MAEKSPQTFENHARLVPAYHFVAFPLFAINFFYALYQVVTDFSWGNLVAFGVSVALILLFFIARVMALTVQDRVIRLEETLRMRALLPADLQARIGEFTVKQMVALRFASDGELPDLARQVIDGKLQDQKAIKKMVRQWRADHQRA